MCRSLPFFVLAASLASCATLERPEAEERGRELAHELLILDGHVDVPYRLWEQRESGTIDDVAERTTKGDFDYPRAVEGGLDAPFFSIYVPSECEERGDAKKTADDLIDMVEGIVARAPQKFTIARTAAEVRAAGAEKKIAVLLGMENGSPIEGDLANLDHFYERGVRYITLCHALDNHICDSSYDTRHSHKGLTPFGREVVRRMNELGVLVDVSHVSDDTFWQVMDIAQAPAIASHSSLRHFVPGFERDMSDEMVKRLAKNGGVIQINFGSTFLTQRANDHGKERKAAVDAFTKEGAHAEDSPETKVFAESWDREHPFPYASVQDVADHIDHVVAIAGIDHVGLGSDFDGVGDSLPTGLKDVSHYPHLIAELLMRGYSKSDIEKICAGNVLRVMEAAERAAQSSGGAERP
jgi:membrane dipeptidase